MIPWSHDGVTVNRVQVTCSADALLARQRADRAVRAGLVRPSALPPHAILCVRTMADPRPGALVLHHDGVAPVDWTTAVSQALAATAARAQRPIDGTVPPDANAVVFADRAELLACLAIDWCAHRVHERWWWRALLGAAPAPTTAIDAWMAAPTLGAAALELLAAQGWAETFVARFDDREASALFDRVVQASGNAAAPPAGPAAELAHHSALSATGPLPRGGVNPPIPAAAPWHAWAPEATRPGLTPPQARLLGVALTLRRAPARAVTPAFFRAATAWPGGQDAGVFVGTPGDRIHVEVPRAGAPGREAPLGLATSDGWAVHPASPPPAPPLRQASVSSAAVSSAHADTMRGERRPRVLGPVPPPRVEPPEQPQRATAVGRTREITVCTETDVGGVFFLLNLGIALGLYGDFTVPAQPGIALSIWDFVTLLGRRLARGAARRDPVWRLLADLARRAPGDPPGEGFEPPSDWRVPAEWLTPFAPPPAATRQFRQWHCVVRSDRLLVRHPTGFLVIDVAHAAGEPAEAQAHRECRAYSRVPSLGISAAPCSRTSGSRARAPVTQWIERLLPYVRARLTRAMPGVSRRRVGPLLCRLSARVLVTPAHLHVVFPLEQLPIETRLSGLDRDPGWVPAAGRTVTFAFE